jgi:hypothetical protein
MQGTAMWVGAALVTGIGEHVVDEAQQCLEGSGRSLEHMFGSLGIGSDGSGVSQGILQAGRPRRSPGARDDRPELMLGDQPFRSRTPRELKKRANEAPAGVA